VEVRMDGWWEWLGVASPVVGLGGGEYEGVFCAGSQCCFAG